MSSGLSRLEGSGDLIVTSYPRVGGFPDDPVIILSVEGHRSPGRFQEALTFLAYTTEAIVAINPVAGELTAQP